MQGSQEMSLPTAPPYGFQEIVPLDRSHRIDLPQGRSLPPVFHSMNPLPVSFDEFAVASRDYPLVFTSADQGRTFTPVLVTGLANNNNLFVMWDKSWDRRVYLPAYVRCYPFCVVAGPVDGRGATERVICIERRAIHERGVPLFDGNGNPTAVWEPLQKLLIACDADRLRTEGMCRHLAELQLLELFSAQVQPAIGAPVQLSGMYRVSESRLNQLDGSVLRGLAQNGVLGRIYAHLMSLENFQRLLSRSQAHLNRNSAVRPGSE